MDQYHRKRDDAWTNEQEALLEEWGQKAAGLRWLHLESAKFFSIVSDAVTIPTIIISAGAGITALKETCGSSLSIVVGALNLLAALFVALSRYYTPADKAGKHQATSNDFGKLYRKIALELAMPMDRRSGCFEFMLSCRTEYDRLVSTNLQPPGFVIRKYKSQFKTVTHNPEVVNVGLEQVHVAPHMVGGEHDHDIGGEGLPIVRNHPHKHRRARARRASTVLQDSIIDPGKAMQGVQGPNSFVNVVVDPPAQPVEPAEQPAAQPSGIDTPFAQVQSKPRSLMENRLPNITDTEQLH